MGPLLRAHGIIMLIAWPLLAVSGIFFAAWMRPALPNGEWFQVNQLTNLFHFNSSKDVGLYIMYSGTFHGVNVLSG